ncbi:MAG: DUF4279 domain-containing protein [Bacteroidales bacterium]|nr:DUF4279 domain-containing protein [Bacteroidales bacterium]
MDFQAISKLAGIEPTNIEVKGEQQRVRISKHNSFEYHLPASHGKIVQRQYNKLMRAIKNSKQLGEYCKAHGIRVYVQVVIDGITDTYTFPVLHMDKKFISFLADLNNAEVDFDIYTEPWDKEGDDYKQPAIVLPSGECLYKISQG